MAGLIAEETIERVRERIDIVELISSYMPLKRSGGNYQGLCPFHGEKTPSFNVNPARQIFHCFGCGVGGNAISFVMKMEGLSFPEAVRRLGEKVGIEVEEDAPSAEEAKLREKRARLLRVSEAAAEAYERLLLRSPNGEPGRRYLKQRGYDSATAKRFHLGYAPDAFDFLTTALVKLGMEEADAAELGLVRAGRDGRRRYDLFRHRLIFPIQDERGRVVAFGGRTLGDGEPKYLNSPESLLYHKGRILYGFHQAKEEMRRLGEAIVVEGYFDLLALHRGGITQSVATCGTALTSDQARLIKRMAGRVLLLFDQDSAGQKANLRAMDVFLGEGLSPLMVKLDAGEDPDSFLAKHGAETMRQRLEQARPALEIFIEQTLEQCGNTIEGRARGVEAILPKLRMLPSEIERNLYLKALARRTGIDEALLQSGRAVQAPRQRTQAAATTTTARPVGRDPIAEKVQKAQDLILHLLLTQAEIRQRLAQENVSEVLPDPLREKIARALLDLSREREHIEVETLFHRLDGEEHSILSGLLLQEERGLSGELAGQTYDDCRRTVLRYQLQQRCRALTEQVGKAEANGNRAEAARLQAELIELNRKLKGGKIFVS